MSKAVASSFEMYFINDIHAKTDTAHLFSMYPRVNTPASMCFTHSGVVCIEYHLVDNQSYFNVLSLKPLGFNINVCTNFIEKHHSFPHVSRVFNMNNTPVTMLTYSGLMFMMAWIKHSKQPNETVYNDLLDWIDELQCTHNITYDFKNMDLGEFIKIFDTFAKSIRFTCCYIIQLGYVKDVFPKYGLTYDPSIANYIVYKCGETIHAEERLHTHFSTFTSYGFNPKIVKIALMFEGYSDRVEQDIFAQLKTNRVFTKAGTLNPNKLWKISNNPGSTTKIDSANERELFIYKTPDVIIECFDKVFKDYDLSYKKIFSKLNSRITTLEHSNALKDKEIESLKLLPAEKQNMIAKLEKTIKDKQKTIEDKKKTIEDKEKTIEDKELIINLLRQKN